MHVNELAMADRIRELEARVERLTNRVAEQECELDQKRDLAETLSKVREIVKGFDVADMGYEHTVAIYINKETLRDLYKAL